MSLHCCRIVCVQRETVAANELLMDRLDQIGSGGWNQIGDGAALRDHVFGTPSALVELLPGSREVITVSAYPEPTPATNPLRVERTADGQAQITSEPPGGFSLRSSTAARVNLRVEWQSRQNQRVRVHEISTVVAMGGLLQ